MYITKAEAKRLTSATAEIIAFAIPGEGDPGDLRASLVAGDDFVFDTAAGRARLRLNSDDLDTRSRRQLPPWIYIQFDDTAAAKAALGHAAGDRLNPYSGKWNWMDVDAQSMARMMSHLQRIGARNLRVNE